MSVYIGDIFWISVFLTYVLGSLGFIQYFLLRPQLYRDDITRHDYVIGISINKIYCKVENEKDYNPSIKTIRYLKRYICLKHINTISLGLNLLFLIIFLASIKCGW